MVLSQRSANHKRECRRTKRKSVFFSFRKVTKEKKIEEKNKVRHYFIQKKKEVWSNKITNLVFFFNVQHFWYNFRDETNAVRSVINHWRWPRRWLINGKLFLLFCSTVGLLSLPTERVLCRPYPAWKKRKPKQKWNKTKTKPYITCFKLLKFCLWYYHKSTIYTYFYVIW